MWRDVNEQHYFQDSFTDIVENGVLKDDIKTFSVMIESESDLDNLNGYTAGSIAYTAGFKGMWQLDSSGEWVAIVEEAES